MDIYEIRRNNLQKILTSQFDNYRTGLAMALERQPSYISRCLSSIPTNRKRIGESFARHIEDKLRLPLGALDIDPRSEGQDVDVRLASQHSTTGLPRTRSLVRVKISGAALLDTTGSWDTLEKTNGWVDLPTSDPDAYSLRIKGDEMAPTIRNGWVVWCEPNHCLVPGEYVKILGKNGVHMIKEMLYENNDEISFMTVNDGNGRLTMPREQIEHIHYVGGIIQPSKIEQ